VYLVNKYLVINSIEMKGILAVLTKHSVGKMSLSLSVEWLSNKGRGTFLSFTFLLDDS